MKNKLLSACIITVLIVFAIAFLMHKGVAGTESTEDRGLRDALIDKTNNVIIEMGVLRDLQTEMRILKSTWDSVQVELREMGLNKLGDVAQMDVVNTIVKMWAIIPGQTKRTIDRGNSVSSYMQEAIDMVQTQLFHTDSAVELYDTAWAELSGAIYTHNYSHRSGETDHSTPTFVSNWKYSTDFPTFLCAGDCGNEYDTPVSPNKKVCGVDDDSSVSGCGKFYFTCKQNDLKRHGVLYCGKDIVFKKYTRYWYDTEVLGICGTAYRRCDKPAKTGVHSYSTTFKIESLGKGYLDSYFPDSPTKHGKGTTTPPAVSIYGPNGIGFADDTFDKSPGCNSCIDGSKHCPGCGSEEDDDEVDGDEEEASSTPQTPTPTPQTPTTPIATTDSTSYKAGSTVTVTVSSSEAIYGAYLYVSGTQIGWFGGSTTTSSLTLTYKFPDSATVGSYTISVSVYDWNENQNSWGDSTSIDNTVSIVE